MLCSRMDSYVLAEMFKYLYLLFAEKEDMAVDIDDFIFTTEAHLLPLALSMGNLTTAVPKVGVGVCVGVCVWVCVSPAAPGSLYGKPHHCCTKGRCGGGVGVCVGGGCVYVGVCVNCCPWLSLWETSPLLYQR